jgi:hypothetical protein
MGGRAPVVAYPEGDDRRSLARCGLAVSGCQAKEKSHPVRDGAGLRADREIGAPSVGATG